MSRKPYPLAYNRSDMIVKVRTYCYTAQLLLAEDIVVRDIVSYRDGRTGLPYDLIFDFHSSTSDG